MMSMLFGVVMAITGNSAMAGCPIEAGVTYQELDGIVYTGVCCTNGVGGGGTFLNRDSAAAAAVAYCEGMGATIYVEDYDYYFGYLSPVISGFPDGVIRTLSGNSPYLLVLDLYGSYVSNIWTDYDEFVPFESSNGSGSGNSGSGDSGSGGSGPDYDPIDGNYP